MPLPKRLAKFDLVVTNRVLGPLDRHRSPVPKPVRVPLRLANVEEFMLLERAEPMR